MSRRRRGWQLRKKSWALLSGHRELIRYPLYGAAATIPLAVVLIGPGLLLVDRQQLAGAIPLFRGETEVTLSDGLVVARARFAAICGWAALST